MVSLDVVPVVVGVLVTLAGTLVGAGAVVAFGAAVGVDAVRDCVGVELPQAVRTKEEDVTERIGLFCVSCIAPLIVRFLLVLCRRLWPDLV